MGFKTMSRAHYNINQNSAEYPIMLMGAKKDLLPFELCISEMGIR